VELVNECHHKLSECAMTGHPGGSHKKLTECDRYHGWNSNTVHPQILVHSVTPCKELLGLEYKLKLKEQLLGLHSRWAGGGGGVYFNKG
jgi:hypothetical protein